VSAFGQEKPIISLSRDGQDPDDDYYAFKRTLVCSGLKVGVLAVIEKAASTSGPWSQMGMVVGSSNGVGSTSIFLDWRVKSEFFRARFIPKSDDQPTTGMVLIPAGKFEMSWGGHEDSYFDTNSGWVAYWVYDVVPVYISAFQMDRTEVTKAHWDEVYNWATNHGYRFYNRGSGKALDHPIQTVNWLDAIIWCNARSEMEGLSRILHQQGVDYSLARRAGWIRLW